MADEQRTRYESPSWRPIETAPRDGTPVLAFVPTYYQGAGGQAVVTWMDYPDRPGWYSDVTSVHEPTHWMPLPLYVPELTPGVETDDEDDGYLDPRDWIWLTTSEASELLGHSPDWWRRAAADIPGARREAGGGPWALPLSGCRAHLAARRKEGKLRRRHARRGPCRAPTHWMPLPSPPDAEPREPVADEWTVAEAREREWCQVFETATGYHPAGLEDARHHAPRLDARHARCYRVACA